jgi:hypothetical protein
MTLLTDPHATRPARRPGRLDVLRARWMRGARQAAAEALSQARAARPSVRRQQGQRVAMVERAGAALAGLPVGGPACLDGRALMEAMFPNPNLWLRFALLRAALGLDPAQQTVVTGPFRADDMSLLARSLGITDLRRQAAYLGDRGAARRHARKLIDGSSSPDDILQWDLPFGFPTDNFYDGLLRFQRRAFIDIGEPRLLDDVATLLQYLWAADRLVDDDLGLVAVNAGTTPRYGGLVWLALQRGVPVVILTGKHGVTSYMRWTTPEHRYTRALDRPTGAQIDALPPAKAEALARVGQDYLQRRFAGESRDVGGIFAYRRNRAPIARREMAAQFGWDAERPVVGIYGSNWIDVPHKYGLSVFRDFFDWLACTVRTATATSQVNWLFRPHPTQARFGGQTLRSVWPQDLPAHVRLAEESWSGADVMGCVDAVVTCHGTIGIEAAAMGKPVMVVDRGWYHDCGFVLWPGSRAAFLEALARPWWQELDLERTQRRAAIFAGWVFGVPDWQRGFLAGDDSAGEALYPGMPALIADNPDEVRREIATIRRWYLSDEPAYHTFKVAEADALDFAIADAA